MNDSSQNNGCLDFSCQFTAALKAAEEYGNEMESLYDEPNEYSTSKFESISMYLNDQINKLKDFDGQTVQVVKIPKVFVDDIEEHHHKGCDCASRSLKEFLKIFPNATIQQIV